MHKNIIIVVLTAIAVLVVAFFFACGQQTSTVESSFVKEVAESMAQQAKSSSQNTQNTDEMKQQSIQAEKVTVQETQMGSPDADGWYTPPDVSGMPAGMTMKIRFHSSGEVEGRNWLYDTEIFGPDATQTPDYIESLISGPGLMQGETVSFRDQMDWRPINYGSVTPEVKAIVQTTTSYEVQTKDTISLASVNRATGVGTVTATGSNNRPSGTMNINHTMYFDSTAGRPIYGSETISGSMTDPRTGTSHAVSGTMQHITIDSKEWMYGTMIDADLGLVGIINVNLTDSSGSVLDMMQTPWKIYTFTVGST